MMVLVMLAIFGTAMSQEYTFTSEYGRDGAMYGKPKASYTTVKLPGQRMRNAGRILTIGGGALAIGGLIMMSNADDLYYTSTQSQYGTVTEGDAKGALGVLMSI